MSSSDHSVTTEPADLRQMVRNALRLFDVVVESSQFVAPAQGAEMPKHARNGRQRRLGADQRG